MNLDQESWIRTRQACKQVWACIWVCSTSSKATKAFFFSGSHSQNMSVDFQRSLVERYSIFHHSSHPVVQLLRCVQLYNLLDCSMRGFPVLYYLPEFAQTEVHQDSDDLILCLPLRLLPLIFPSILVFSNESAPCIRWPKYWSFSFSPCNEYSGLISFRIDWFDLLAVQGTFKSLLQQHSSKASIL